MESAKGLSGLSLCFKEAKERLQQGALNKVLSALDKAAYKNKHSIMMQCIQMSTLCQGLLTRFFKC